MTAGAQLVSGGGRKTDSKNRIVFLDYLRAFMPLIIIAVHVMESADWKMDFGSSSYFWLSAIMRVCRIGMPMFCMISGALFLDPHKKFDTKKHFTKTIPRILLIYLFWSPLYALVLALLSPGGAQERLMTFWDNAFTGYWHLWYLEMMICAYLLVPLMRAMTKRMDLLRYVMGIIIAVLTLWTAESMLETLVLARGSEGFLKGLLSNVDGSLMAIADFLGVNVLIFFFAGSYLVREKFTQKQRGILYVLGILGLIMAIVFPAARSRVLNTDYAFMASGLEDIGTFFYICATFVFVKELLKKKTAINRVVAFMAKRSLGVYILHILPIMILSKMFVVPAWHGWGMIVAIPGSVLVIYLFSLLFSWLFSKIPLLRRVV